MSDPNNNEVTEEALQESSTLDTTEVSGYKTPPKRTIEELANLDNEDESLKKWKESLGIYSGAVVKNPDDPRKLVLLKMVFNVDGVEKMSVDLNKPGAAKEISSIVVEAEEGKNYEVILSGIVQNDTILRLRYADEVRPTGILRLLSEKSTNIIGSFSPSSKVHVWTVKSGVLPDGKTGRGKYKVLFKLDDDDTKKEPHFESSFMLHVVQKN